MKTCPVCSEQVKAGRKLYCSRKCYFSDRKREKHWNWKGGGQRNKEGYIWRVVYPENPFFEMGSKHSEVSNIVPEHRLVMAESLGRPLRKDESVHHLNGIKDDNRIENLQLRNGKHGAGTAMCCADCGSRNLIPVELG